MSSCLQGSHTVFFSRPSWSRGLLLKRRVTRAHMLVKMDSHLSVRRNPYHSVGSPYFRGPKAKSLRILSFKGSARNDETGSGSGGSRVSKNCIKLSFVSDKNEDAAKASESHDVAISYDAEENKAVAGSAAIQKLFRKWLTMLRSQSPSPVMDVLGEEASLSQKTETEDIILNQGKGGALKLVWQHLWALDATIKFPLLIFAPLYLAVNVAYGKEVSRELTPLWIFGPLIVALYVKMLQWLCALYVFSFKQTVLIIKNLPSYYVVACSYIAHGKLKEELRARFWQPVAEMKNADYKEFSRRKLKELQEWMVEKYLDFIESIWPYYCRTIRFLKRANLI